MDKISYEWIRDTDFTTWTTQELQELVVELSDLMRDCLTPPFYQGALHRHCREMRAYPMVELHRRVGGVE